MSETSPRRSLLYVTDLERRPSGGGSYAVNWHAAIELEKRFALTYAGPLVPTLGRIETTVSKFRRRIAGRPGRFTYFSPATLDANARMVERYNTPGTEAIVFRSAARWCHCRPSVPYFVYLDAVFRTFFENTFDSRSFHADDIDRICAEEAAFLENASAVFFESQWGLDKARSSYALTGDRYSAPGRGGVVAPPASDTFMPGSHKLVTIAMNFQQKGGNIVMEAFRSLKPRYPDLEWHVIGAEPDGDWTSIPGITHEGELRPDDPAELTRLTSLLANAFLIVHPALEDTSPLVLTEAAYFGCPAVSVNRFAIPELVANGVTGILVDYPPAADDVAAAIATLVDDPSRYADMRREARVRSLARSAWDAVGSRISAEISRHLPPEGAA